MTKDLFLRRPGNALSKHSTTRTFSFPRITIIGHCILAKPGQANPSTLGFIRASKTAIRNGDRTPTRGILSHSDELLTAPQQLNFTTMGPCSLDFDDWIYSVQRYFPEQLRYTYWPIEASRGCWWGEKSQCKFCGLNGTQIAYRRKPAESVLQDLQHISSTFGHLSRRVMFVDNILDMSYFKTLLPVLESENLQLSLFCETKANLTREHVQGLRRAGFDVIQPGIESLSSHVLALMKKGVTALQNVRLLKYTVEADITPVWNLIYGFMGETEDDYVKQVQLMKRLHHLPPPLSVNRFRLDRFSPYFENAAAEGIEIMGPHTTYQYVYRDLDIATVPDLFYFFDYVPHTVSEDLIDQISEEVRCWQRQYGTRRLWLDVDDHNNWTVSTVTKSGTTQSNLSPIQAWVLQVLDTSHPEDFIKAMAKDIWDDNELKAALDELCFEGWVVSVDARFLSVLPLTDDARKLLVKADPSRRLTSQFKGGMASTERLGPPLF